MRVAYAVRGGIQWIRPPPVHMLLCLAMLACSTPQAPTPPAAAPAEPVAVVEEAVFVEEQAPPSVNCDGAFTTNTRVSIPRGTVVIDRFEGHERTERITLQLAEITRLEHELQAVSLAPLASGEERRCSAIFLVLADGRRILFDEDPVADLEPRARRLAETMSLPLEVVRDDVDGSAAR